ncbi:hypothetical protein HPB48_010276 [Haemaphysalis longicornis]|uniref:RNA-dependent RNA polymerase n=1 Tax=Haemaphysalis longicornis TaxID=44386 RepID=A0A9J6FU31_HAELO|nr:hypothetical protein HPB48_010276 [Haemaphysalis longicornis]
MDWKIPAGEEVLANEDIIRFLCNYILNDSVGIMSNAHLAWADQDRQGIFSPVCLSLARKISICLDFAKTGLSESLSKEERPQRYPDFMTKRGIKVNYRSSRVLGELYRLNKTLVGSSSVTYTSGDFDRALFEYPGWRRHEDTADRAKSTYTGLMSQILKQHGIETEAEVIAGTINSVSRYNKSKKDKTSVETLVAKQYRALVATMQDQFLADVDAASRGDTKRTLLEMASAWYMEENSLGLPWCIPEVLLLLLRERSGSYPLERPLARSLLVKKIDEHCDNCSPQDAAFDLLCKWARNEELLGTGVRREPQVCESFIKRAFQQYMSNERILSAGGYVSGFLRYLSTVPTVLPVCTGCSSTSQHVHVLTLAALHCYSRMVISRDVCCFGLQCDTDHNGAQEIQESEPIRINTQTGRFLDMVQRRPDTVQELLCRWTGVQQVNIRVNSYRSDKHHYILISAVGRLWQLCCFEELVTQSWLQDAVVRGSLS